MKQSDTDRAYSLASGLQRNYVDWPSTFGKCSGGCDTLARGSGLCADCYERKLAEIVGEESASHFHDAVKARHKAYHEMIDGIE